MVYVQGRAALGKSLHGVGRGAPSAAPAGAARPGTDTRVPNDHQPTAASQALPPTLPAESAPKPPPTESTKQPPPVLSVSERLWNAAYDSLEAENAELVMSYVKTLETILGANPGVAPDTSISAELHNPTKRQMHMWRLVEGGQARISRASRITNGVGEVADFVDMFLPSTPVPRCLLLWSRKNGGWETKRPVLRCTGRCGRMPGRTLPGREAHRGPPMPPRNCWQRRASVCLTAATLGPLPLRTMAAIMTSSLRLSGRRRGLGGGHGSGGSAWRRSKTAGTLTGVD